MSNKPSSITGGCLCEGVRYTLTFPDTHDFTKSASTCQCSDCRKQTGSLMFRAQKVSKSSIVYSTKASLKIYRASPDCERGFCGECGSLLFWCETKADKTCICVGTFDKECLKTYGTLLTYAERHLWCIDEIEGVTTHLKGTKWKYDDEHGVLW